MMQGIIHNPPKYNHQRREDIHEAIVRRRGNDPQNERPYAHPGIQQEKVGPGRQASAFRRGRFDRDGLKAGKNTAIPESDYAAGHQKHDRRMCLTQENQSDGVQNDTGVYNDVFPHPVKQSPGKGTGYHNHDGVNDKEIAGDLHHPQLFCINRNKREQSAISKRKQQSSQGDRYGTRFNEIFPMKASVGGWLRGAFVFENACESAAYKRKNRQHRQDHHERRKAELVHDRQTHERTNYHRNIHKHRVVADSFPFSFVGNQVGSDSSHGRRSEAEAYTVNKAKSEQKQEARDPEVQKRRYHKYSGEEEENLFPAKLVHPFACQRPKQDGRNDKSGQRQSRFPVTAVQYLHDVDRQRSHQGVVRDKKKQTAETNAKKVFTPQGLSFQ